MRDLQTPVPPRALRAAIRDLAQEMGDGALRVRRGSQSGVRAEWRRCAMGTNHIACFGVWRSGTRRQAERRNRSGLTRWHMPHRANPVLAEIAQDAVGQDSTP